MAGTVLVVVAVVDSVKGKDRASVVIVACGYLPMVAAIVAAVAMATGLIATAAVMASVVVHRPENLIRFQ